jgi:hypothetical protein
VPEKERQRYVDERLRLGGEGNAADRQFVRR